MNPYFLPCSTDRSLYHLPEVLFHSAVLTSLDMRDPTPDREFRWEYVGQRQEELEAEYRAMLAVEVQRAAFAHLRRLEKAAYEASEAE